MLLVLTQKRENNLVDRASHTRVGSSLHLISDIYRKEGGLRALYRGLTPNIIGNSTSWSIYFLAYGEIKNVLVRANGHPDQLPEEGFRLSASEYFMASGAAGAFRVDYHRDFFFPLYHVLPRTKD